MLTSLGVECNYQETGCLDLPRLLPVQLAVKPLILVSIIFSDFTTKDIFL